VKIVDHIFHGEHFKYDERYHMLIARPILSVPPLQMNDKIAIVSPRTGERRVFNFCHYVTNVTNQFLLDRLPLELITFSRPEEPFKDTIFHDGGVLDHGNTDTLRVLILRKD